MNAWGIDICQACLSDDRPLYPLRTLTSILKEINFLQDIKLLNMHGGVCWECKYLIIKWDKFKKQVLRAHNILYNDLKTQLKYLGSLSKSTNKEFNYIFCDATDNIEQLIIDPLLSMEEDLENKLIIKTEQERCGEENYNESLESKDLLNNTRDLKVNTKDLQVVREIGNYGDSNNESIPQNNNINCSKDIRVNSDEKNLRKIGNYEKDFDEHEYDPKIIIKKDKVRRKVTRKTKKADRESLDKTKDIDKDKYSVTVFTEDELMKNRQKKLNHPNFKKMPFKCEPCVLGFLKQETYDTHMEKKHSQTAGANKCPVCTIHFQSTAAMEKHVQTHYVSYRCKLCHYFTVMRSAMVGHCNNKHGNDRSGSIHCDKCEYIGRTPEDLTEHSQTEHSLSCSDCGVKFKRKGDLRKHRLVIHGTDRQYKCEMCPKTFKTSLRLETHCASHSGALARRLAHCRPCGVTYKNVHVYRSHLRNSPRHSDTVYPCKDCNKRFPSKVMWRKHYSFYHLKRSKHSCTVCDKLFLSRSRLKAHLQTHHGLSRTRSHCCDVCHKKFYTQSTLKTHYLTHMSQRNYMCDKCGESFKQRASFHTHVRLLHGSTKKVVSPVGE